MADLSPHFSVAEFTRSQTALRKGIDNDPPIDLLPNMRRLASVLESVRTLLGNPIQITSGYRSPALNLAVGGSRTSAHCQGRAADFVCPGYGDPLDICQAIIGAGIGFDQLIYEGDWVHLGIAPAGHPERRQVLTARFLGGHARYTLGLP